MATAPSFPGGAIFLPSQHLQKSVLIFTAIWTPMDNKVPICALLNGCIYRTSYMF